MPGQRRQQAIAVAGDEDGLRCERARAALSLDVDARDAGDLREIGLDDGRQIEVLVGDVQREDAAFRELAQIEAQRLDGEVDRRPGAQALDDGVDAVADDDLEIAARRRTL